MDQHRFKNTLFVSAQISQVSKSVYSTPMQDRKPKSTQELFELVHSITGVSPERIIEKKRNADQCFARQLCMYILHVHCGIAKVQITKEVNLLNHTTIIHGIRAIEIIKETKYHPYYRWVLECESFYY